MPHIHTEKGQIDHTVSAYIIRDDLDEPRLLLHMHKKHHKLLQIGGHIELDETIWGALAHEVEEESGYEFASLKVLQPALRIDDMHYGQVVHPLPFYINTHDVTDDGAHFHTDIAYLLVADQAPQGKPAPDESQDLRWLSLADLEACGDDLIYPDIRLVCMSALRDFYPAWQAMPVSEYSIDVTAKHR